MRLPAAERELSHSPRIFHGGCAVCLSMGSDLLKLWCAILGLNNRLHSRHGCTTQTVMPSTAAAPGQAAPRPATGARCITSTGWVKDDGPTDITKLTLACGPDNRLVEEGGWTTRKRKDGRTKWIPPPHLDTGQSRVNDYQYPEKYLRPEGDDPS